jgi:hypothetical protein
VSRDLRVNNINVPRVTQQAQYTIVVHVKRFSYLHCVVVTIKTVDDLLHNNTRAH